DARGTSTHSRPSFDTAPPLSHSGAAVLLRSSERLRRPLAAALRLQQAAAGSPRVPGGELSSPFGSESFPPAFLRAWFSIHWSVFAGSGYFPAMHPARRPATR